MADAGRLKGLFLERKERDGLTQEALAQLCGWEGQSATAAYLNGKTPLNLAAARKFAQAFDVPIDAFSPSLAEEARSYFEVTTEGQRTLDAVTDQSPALSRRLARATPETRRLVELALLEGDEEAERQLSPSLVSMVRALKQLIAANEGGTR